ncbi:MAG: peptide chain release factor N(5)-glutamine methyltransferase [Spirochaetales bacterium]|nr:peptide chain release factor N(5)-glutamine methyltransferase [Spirochaetales bacterium]
MNLSELYNSFTDAFRETGDSPSADAAILICHCLGITRTQLVLSPNEEIPQDKLEELMRIKTARENGEPVAYLTGERGFYECVFSVSPDTLIPRADTETLVEEAVADIAETFEDRPEIRILDLCCGTGCIGISVAKVLSEVFEKVTLVLSDVSEKAMDVCRKNAEALIGEDNIEVTFNTGNLFEGLDGVFDAVLSNPPYIATSVIPTLEKQVQFEPVLALDGGADGLDFVRKIAASAKDHLVPGGILQMEIGYDQGKQARDILRKEGYRKISVIKDLEDCDRVVKALN